jgi:2,4-dienoyl-CoA reductase-like NADH-dependent reductase (Old Yellow Enzyme family)
MTTLFDELKLRDLTLRNRMVLPPMAQYMCKDRDGIVNAWHLVHYGARAQGGFGLIITEATAVAPEGRITPFCAGIWNDAQRDAWKPIVEFVHQQGAAIGIQLNHAGRKGSVAEGKTGTLPASEGGWQTIAPSAVEYPGLDVPQEMTLDDIARIKADFVAAAKRADEAGFDVVELHAAHGYLLFEFLSPLSNRRTDEYGGGFDERTRLLVEICDEIRTVWPAEKPLLVRISATEWLDVGWTVGRTQKLATLLKDHGVDMMDVSSGGNVPAKIDAQPGYQVWLARKTAKSGLPVITVGLITSPKQAKRIMDEGGIDCIAIGRAALRRPFWPLWAGYKLGIPADQMPYPPAYVRGAFPEKKSDKDKKESSS